MDACIFEESFIASINLHRPDSGGIVMRTRFSMLIAIFIMFAALHARISWGADRFFDNGDKTISDNQTGLMWQKTDDDTARYWAGVGA
jgi:hypothetical protein